MLKNNSGGYMKFLASGLMFLILPFCTHATFYINTDIGHNKLTINSDTTSAVYISNGKAQRFLKSWKKRGY